MKHTYFVDYIKDIDAIYDKHLEIYDNLISDVEAAKRKLEKAKKDNGPYRAKKIEVAQLELKEAEQNFTLNARRNREEAGRELRDLRAEMAKDVEEAFAADPSKIDSNALALMNSGIMNTSDLVRMANANWNNPTMLRLIRNHCENRKFVDNRDEERGRNASLINAIIKHASDKDRLELFGAAEMWIEKCLQDNPNVAAAMQKHYPDAISKISNSMAMTDSFNVEV